MSNPVVKEAVLKEWETAVSHTADHMNGRKIDPSYLMLKSFHDLKKTAFEPMVEEFQEKFPELFRLVFATMVPPSLRSNADHIQRIMPRLAMVYSVMMFTRNHELSRLQRVMAMCFNDQMANQKVKQSTLSTFSGMFWITTWSAW